VEVIENSSIAFMGRMRDLFSCDEDSLVGGTIDAATGVSAPAMGIVNGAQDGKTGSGFRDRAIL